MSKVDDKGRKSLYSKERGQGGLIVNIMSKTHRWFPNQVSLLITVHGGPGV